MAEERVTNFYVDYAIEDTTAKQDAVFSCDVPQHALTNLSRLRYYNKDLRFDKMTFEHNFNILDGTKTALERDAFNGIPFTNNTFVDNSIIFEERDDGSIIARSSSKVKHKEAIYSKTFTLKYRGNPQFYYNFDFSPYYVSGGCEGGSESTYKVVFNICGRIHTCYDSESRRYNNAVPRGWNITVSIHVAADYFIEQPIVFRPVLSKMEGPYVKDFIPFFTRKRTDDNGTYYGRYDKGPILSINFKNDHSSVALTLRFLEDHPLLLKLIFYDSQNNILASFDQKVLSNEVVIWHEVIGYRKITIEFLETLPYRSIKLASIIFGTTVTWDETNVRDAKLVQQVDRISKNISVDTLSFTVVDDKSELNLGNPDGINAYFQKNQYMLPYEIVNNKKVELGKYYLKTFSENANLGKMSAQSYLGIMDDIIFNEGEVYNGKKAGLVIEQIFQVMGLTEYFIDAETYEQPLYGTIAPKSCRKALNDILFACNSIIDAHDTERILIMKTSEIQKSDIHKRSKFSTTVTKNDYTYGVEVKYTNYIKESSTREIAKAKYLPGKHTIYFTQPYTEITVTNAIIKMAETNYYYVTFTVTGTEEEEVVIEGYSYQTVTNSQRTVQDKLKSGETERIVSYSTSLCDAKTAKTLSEKILAHLNYDLTIKIKWLADGNDMRDLHIVENPINRFNDYFGGFTKRSFDLTGGFIDTAEMLGTSLKNSPHKYLRDTDIEVYNGEDDGII